MCCAYACIHLTVKTWHVYCNVPVPSKLFSTHDSDMSLICSPFSFFLSFCYFGALASFSAILFYSLRQPLIATSTQSYSCLNNSIMFYQVSSDVNPFSGRKCSVLNGQPCIYTVFQIEFKRLTIKYYVVIIHESS